MKPTYISYSDVTFNPDWEGQRVRSDSYLTSCTDHSLALVSHQSRSESHNKSSTQENCP